MPEAGSNKLMGKADEPPPPDTQFNAGELLGCWKEDLKHRRIHVRMKLERCVSENMALFAKALVPSCMSFAARQHFGMS